MNASAVVTSAEAVPIVETRRAQGTFSLARFVLSIGLIQVLTMIFTLGRSKVVAVMLGPAGVGTVGLLDQVVGVVTQICAFSLPAATVKFLSTAHSDGHSVFARLYATFFRLLLALSVLGTACAAAVLWLWPGVLGPELVAHRGLAILALCSIPAMHLSVLVTNALAAARRARAAAIYGFLFTAASVIFAVAGVLLFGLRGYYGGAIVGMCLLVAGGGVFLHSREGVSVRAAHLPRGRSVVSYRDIASFSAALYVASFTTPVADLVARLAVLRVGGLPAVGLFQAALGLALALRTVVRASFGVFFIPAVNRRTSPHEKFADTVTFIRATVLISGLMALPLVLFPKIWLTLLYSRAFAQVFPYVSVFALAIIVQLCAAAVQMLVAGLDHIGTFAMSFVLSDAITGSLSWLLVPRIGLYGVGIGLLLNGIVMFGLGAWKVWTSHRLNLSSAVGWSIAATLAIVACGGALGTFLPSDSVATITTKVLAGVVLAVAAFLWAGRQSMVRPEDRRAIRPTD